MKQLCDHRSPDAEANPAETFCVEFFGPVSPKSVNRLMSVVEGRVKQGAKRMVPMLSTPGGTVFHGITAYNYLRRIPLDVTVGKPLKPGRALRLSLVGLSATSPL